MPNNPLDNIDQVHLEVFQEIGNIGAGNAATALAGILNRRIDMSVPKAKIVPFDTIVNLLEGPETIVAGVLIDISMDLNGYVLLVLHLRDAAEIMKLALNSDESAESIVARALSTGLGEIEYSVMLEVSNILAGSFLSAISSMTGLRIVPSIPQLSIDMLGAIMSIVAIQYGQSGDSVLFLDTRFSDDAKDITGNFFLIPDYESYKKLIGTLGID
ncbi:MAG: chemotaxis protein CheC [Oscillospiraceae bacterium]|jgi:chemotaxis protein CheC|nr:chemotaxis protein CheC [Oscillospiraceae bacterium]